MITVRRIFYVGSAFADQACFALGNFVITLILARCLSKPEYGVFSIAFTLYTFGLVLFTAVIVEPMMVFGSGRWAPRLDAYLIALKQKFWTMVWPPLAAIVILIGALYRSWPTFVVLVTLAAASGPIFFQWMQRRSCHLRREPWLSALGGVIYLLLVVTLCAASWKTDTMSAIQGVIIMCAAAMGGSVAIALMTMRRKSPLPDSDKIAEVGKEIVGAHAVYARWSIPASVMAWIPGNIYMLALPLMADDVAAARLRAAMNLLLPILQFQAALAPIILPWLVRRVNDPNYRKKVALLAITMALPPLLWTGLLFFCGNFVQQLFYGGRYNETPALVAAFGVSAVLSAMVLVVAASLRAQERPKFVFTGYLGATITCVLVGLPLMARFGLGGVAAGLAFSALTNLFLLTILLTKFGRNPHAPTPKMSISL